jgi:uncharacterized C2H2 Zn-finger protein
MDCADWTRKQVEDVALATLINALGRDGTKPGWTAIAPFGEEMKTLWAQWDSLRLVDGVLCRVWENPGGTQETLQTLVPKALRKQIFDFLHGSKTGGHFGISNTLGKIKEKFYWPKLRNDVQTWCAQCDMCAARKGPTRKIKAPLTTYVVGLPMERVAVDMLGPLPVSDSGNKYILIAMDYFTKWPEAYPLPNQEAETVAKVLVDQFVCRFGAPAELHSDQGRNFESQVFAEMCKLLGIKKTRTTPLHPQSDGMVERYNRTLEHQLAIFVNENQRDWDEHIPLLLMAYRTSTHELTGITPAKMMMGRDLSIPLDLVMGHPPQRSQESRLSYVARLKESLDVAHKFARERLKLTAERMKTRYNVKATAVRLDVGASVWLYRPQRKKGISPKLSKPRVGPYTIVKRINDLVYRIVDVAHKFARERLKLTADRMKTRYNVKVTAVRLDVGASVWLYRPRKKGISPKLSKPWVGPYTIVKRINDLVYRIQLSNRSKPMVVHRNRLREYVGEIIPELLSREGRENAGQEEIPEPQRRRSTRTRRAPVRLEL